MKAVGASFSQLITATMISRLVLNLRSAARSPPGGTYDGPSAGAAMKFMTRTVGNLGEELGTIFDDNEPHRSTTEDIPLVDNPGSQNHGSV